MRSLRLNSMIIDCFLFLIPKPKCLPHSVILKKVITTTLRSQRELKYVNSETSPNSNAATHVINYKSRLF